MSGQFLTWIIQNYWNPFFLYHTYLLKNYFELVITKLLDSSPRIFKKIYEKYKSNISFNLLTDTYNI
jgi:hypothetical protein